MKVVIPAAGPGTRLFPHTYTKPKAMVSIAGKPIIGHILDRMLDLEPEQVIIVVGYKKEHIISYINENYRKIFDIQYVEQEKREGIAHSIYLTRDVVQDSPVMIALGDMIFKSGYIDFFEQHKKNTNCAGSIGVREVDEPRKYGIVELESDASTVKMLIEKPDNPKSNLGIAGVYFINDSPLLFKILEWMIRNDRKTRGEFQLTDALQEMINRRQILKTFEVSSWYDCGHAKSLLATNRVLLDEQHTENTVFDVKNSMIIQPVSIGHNVTIVNSLIGPYASIADETCIDNSIISNSVIGSRSTISRMNLEASIVGDEANLIGKYNSLNIGDSSSIEF